MLDLGTNGFRLAASLGMWSRLGLGILSGLKLRRAKRIVPHTNAAVREGAKTKFRLEKRGPGMVVRDRGLTARCWGL